MLPSSLISCDGIVPDAAYLPASAESEVGGDWYDTFEAGDGRIGISIGDVVGHGLEAAVEMSEVRGAIRAMSTSTDSPSLVLRRVDDLMAAQGMGLATAIVGFYDPKTGVLRYASAGHPAPALLAPSGSAIFLPAGGVMLGLGAPRALDDIIVTIPAGATLFLYTDGLLGKDVLAGERALLRALESLRVQEGRAESLHAILFDEKRRNSDDCATLAIHRIFPADHSTERLTYSAIPSCAALAREAMRYFSERFVNGDDRRSEIISAVGEAVANAIEHCRRDTNCVFEVEARADGGSVSIEVRSQGHWQPFRPSIEHGRGLQIMRTYANNIEVYSAQDETRVTLTFS
jgi:anti-sigma regulatory factor (Ser/Thr protein kinase)